MTSFTQLHSLPRLCLVSLIAALLWGLWPPATAAPSPTHRPTGPVAGQNYVFRDNNLNGIYDAGDAGLTGVAINLYREPDGLLLETVTSTTAGLFSFTTVGTTGIAYSIRIKTADAPAGLKLVTANQGNDDVNDSDASLLGSTAVINAQYTGAGFSGNYSFGYSSSDPDMTITKTSDSFSVVRGGQATFTLSVSNVGGSTATGVVIRDTLAVGMTLVSTTPATTTALLGSGQVEITWTLGNVLAGTGNTYTVQVQANADGVLTNVAGVTATSADATPRNNQARAAFTVPTKLCPGDTYVASLSNNQTNVTWFRNGLAVANGNSYTVTTSGSYNYTATTAGTDCQPGGCLPLIFYDGGVPNLSITPSLTAICAGTSTQLTANNCTNGTIAWNTGSTASSITVTPPVGSNTYSFTCTPTSASACPASASAIVTVNPSVTATLSSATICNGTVATLSATGGTNYLFSDGTTNTTGILSVTPIATTIYSVTVTNGNGCSAIASATVTVNPAVTAVIAANPSLTICNGTTTTLTASGGTGYVWSTGDLTASIPVSPTATTAYSVTVTNAFGCSAIASTTVTVNPSVTAVMTNSTICNGTSATLVASGGTDYLFSNGTTNTTGSLIVSPSVTTSYSVTVTNAFGCSAIASGTVTVNPSVTATLSSATICNGTVATLSATGGTSYLFSDGTTNTTGILSVTPIATTIYSVTVTNGNGCSAIASATVTVNPAVTAVIAANPSLTICNGTTTTLTASGGTGYVWSTGDLTASIPVSPTATTAYSVTVTNAFGCSAIASTTVTVNPSVTATLTSATICNGIVASLIATGGTNYFFSDGTTNTTGILSVNPTTTTVYSVTVTNGNGCSAIASATVTINPSVTATLSSATICNGTSGTLSAAGGTSYVFSNGITNTTGSLVVAPTTTTIYSVTVTNAFGCSAITSGTVTVNPAVTAVVTASQTICSGNTVTLTASGGTGYVWSTGDLTASIPVSPTATTAYSVTVTNAFGCSANASTTVTVNPTPVLTVNSPTICVGTSALLSLSGCEGTVTWSTGTTGATLNVSPLATTTYSATCTLGSGCSAVTSTTITVAPTPSVATQNIVVTRATCNGATASNDASIVLSNLQNTVSATISAADSAPAGGDVSVTVTGGVITFGNLANPTQRVTYTIQLVGPTGCTTVIQVLLDPAACACPAAKCVPIVVQKIR